MGLKDYEKELGKWGKRGQMLSLLLVLSCVIYGLVLYSFGAERERNLVYTAMYLDDSSVELYRANASLDAVLYASGTAVQFCDLYRLETRTLERDKYEPLCEAIESRMTLLVFCTMDEYECTEEQIQRLEHALDVAEPIAKELKENPPYYGYVLSFEPTQYVTADGTPITFISEEISWQYSPHNKYYESKPTEERYIEDALKASKICRNNGFEGYDANKGVCSASDGSEQRLINDLDSAGKMYISWDDSCMVYEDDGVRCRVPSG